MISDYVHDVMDLVHLYPKRASSIIAIITVQFFQLAVHLLAFLYSIDLVKSYIVAAVLANDFQDVHARSELNSYHDDYIIGYSMKGH